MVDCPDLTAAPFHLASNGLCGSPTIIDVGGPPFLLPLVDRTKIYDLKSLARKILPNAKSIYLCGAGAGPHPLINSNCEVRINRVRFKIHTHTHIYLFSLLIYLGHYQF